MLNIAVNSILGRSLVHSWLLYFLEWELIDMRQHLWHASFARTHLGTICKLLLLVVDMLLERRCWCLSCQMLAISCYRFTECVVAVNQGLEARVWERVRNVSRHLCFGLILHRWRLDCLIQRLKRSLTIVLLLQDGVALRESLDGAFLWGCDFRQFLLAFDLLERRHGVRWEQQACLERGKVDAPATVHEHIVFLYVVEHGEVLSMRP